MTQKVLTISAGGVFTEAANAGELSFTPVNKAGDTGIGNLSMGALTATSIGAANNLTIDASNAHVLINSNTQAGYAVFGNWASFINCATGALTATTVKVTSAGGYISSDNSTGITTTVTTASLVGKTLTIKDGIITGFA